MAVALWEMIATARPPRGAADLSAWSQISTTLRGQHRPGDLLVFAPAWIDPLGRQHLGDLMSLEMVGRMDSARYPIVWEVGLDQARAPETAGLEADRSWRFGALTLRHYAREPVQVVTDFVEGFSAATQRGARAGRAKVVLTEVGYEPHRCVEVVPAPDGSAVVSYADVELGSELVGYVGLADAFTRRDVREPGHLRVTVDGVQVAQVVAGIDDGWVRFHAATEPGPAHVEFTASAVGPGAVNRRICFAAEARR